MRLSDSAILMHPGRVLVALAVLAAGITTGWFSSFARAPTWELVFSVLDPTLIAALCVGLLHRQLKQARWLVPLLLVGVMLTLATHPHAPRVSAVGLAAGFYAIVCSLRGHTRSAIAATLLCCAATATSLLLGLLR